MNTHHAHPRNDFTALHQNDIPTTEESYFCGCWGKHHPPYIDKNNNIIIETGEGYRSNKHLHGQNLYVIEARPGLALIEMRKYGDLYGAGLWHYIVGVDGAPFVAQVSSKIDTLDVALESLKPVAIKRAEAAGAFCPRQGDWYFMPVTGREPRSAVVSNHALDDDHIADEAIVLRTVTYVRGVVQHGEHSPVLLSGWHKAIQNNAIRTGRLARGGHRD